MPPSIDISLHEPDAMGNILTLRETLVIIWRGRTLQIPIDFSCDGVSTPEFLYGRVSPAVDPRTLRAGLAHDYIYRTQPAGWSRADADKMFYDLCREDGLGWWRAQKAYIGLRLFGGRAWKNNKKTLEKDHQG